MAEEHSPSLNSPTQRAWDEAMGYLLLTMVVFSPWAFGTTQPWSIRLMNGAGYLLGAMLLIRGVFLRNQGAAKSAQRGRNAVTWGLAALTGLILAYALTAAINAGFVYQPRELRADPLPHVEWLPSSLDRDASWRLFWNWLALACSFWAARHWLTSEINEDGHHSTRRLRRLIFVLALNGALVAFEGILQRTADTPKLLFFQPTRDNAMASAQFGPYAYRSNAAQFFNLIWPAALALWWQLRLQGNPRRRLPGFQWLIPSVVLLIAAPLVSLSRGGVMVTMLQLLACGCALLPSRRFSLASKLGVSGVLLGTVLLSLYLGGNQLAQRLESSAKDPLSGRGQTYELAEKMALDYPLFGVGPGAFASVFQLYRNSPEDYWPGQLHNDWLEFRITFGWVGFGLLLTALVLVGGAWFVRGGMHMHWTVPVFLAVAVGGCLLHARFDFPLQIYSIQLVFILLGAMLSSLSRR